VKAKRSRFWLNVIAAFKLVKVSALVVTGVLALRLRGEDLVEQALRLTHRLGLSPGSRFVHEALAKVASVEPRDLGIVAAATFVYAAIFLVEGTGLFLAKRWAEYLTILVTVSFIPFEVWEAARHFSGLKVGAIAVNLAVVVYLVWRVRAERRDEETDSDGVDRQVEGARGGA